MQCRAGMKLSATEVIPCVLDEGHAGPHVWGARFDEFNGRGHCHYIELAERIERLAYDLRQRSSANVVDLLEAAQFIRDHA